MDDVNARFRFVQATSAELKQAIYRLRYQIYVEEYGFEQPQDHPHGLEMDAYDEHAICLAALNEADDVIGTVRLILHSLQGFPIEHVVPTLHVPGDNPSPQCIGEISRLAVSAAYRRRIEDGLYGVEAYLRPPAETGLAGCGVRQVPFDRRKRPVIVLGLYRLLYQVSKQLGLTHWYMIAEKKLWSILRKYHILFNQIGQPVEYHGMRIPYLGIIAEMEAHMQRTHPAFLQSFLMNGTCLPRAHTQQYTLATTHAFSKYA